MRYPLTSLGALLRVVKNVGSVDSFHACKFRQKLL